MSISFGQYLRTTRVRNALLALLLLAATQSTLAATSQLATTEARQQLHAAYVQGEGDVQGVKLAVQTESAWLTEYLSHYGINSTVSFEMSANFWQFGPDNETDQNLVVAFSPILTFPLGQVFHKPLLAEFGIGVSLLDDTTFAGKNVSTHYQFEDRLGLIYQLSREDALSLRYLHYSNAGFKTPNPGLDFIALGYSKAF